MRVGGAGRAGALARASVPVEVSERSRIAEGPLRSTNALSCAVVKDEVLVAGTCCVDTLAVVVIPGEAIRTSALKASAAAVGNSVVKEVANWAWLLFAEA